MAVGVGGGDIWDGNEPEEFIFANEIRSIEYVTSENLDGEGFVVNIPKEARPVFIDGEITRPESTANYQVGVYTKKYKTQAGELVRLGYCKENKTLYLEKK